MIRIDLSREEIGRGGGNTSVTKIFEKLKLPKQLQDIVKKGGGGKSANQSTMLIALAISGAAAVLPTLFFNQYRQYVITDNAVQVKAIQDNIAQVNSDIVKLTPYQKELESFEAQKRQVRERLDVIRQLLEQRGTPVNILDAIGQSLPTRTWVQVLEMTLKNGSPQLNISASSMSNEEISDFVDKLSESVYFNDVVLNDVGSGKEGNVDVKKFSIVAHPKVRGLASATPAAATPVNQAQPNVGGAAPDPATAPNGIPGAGAPAPK